MLDILYQVEKELATMLEHIGDWESVLIDYESPIVERLWCPWGEYRVYLHRIHPCEPSKALFHPHPWPSAMRLVKGNYEMATGFGEGVEPPPIASRLILSSGDAYEMTHPNSWHYVRPLGSTPTLSLMVTGRPWNRTSPKSTKTLNPLSEQHKGEIYRLFRNEYPLF